MTKHLIYRVFFAHVYHISTENSMVFLCGVAWVFAWQAIGAKTCGLTNAWSAEPTTGAQWFRSFQKPSENGAKNKAGANQEVQNRSEG